MTRQRHSTHLIRGNKKAEFLQPEDTLSEMPEVEDIKPLSVKTIPYSPVNGPMVASTELFVKKHDFGIMHFHKVPLNSALVISGPLGTRVVTGRATFVFPTEIANEINLEIIAVPVFETEILTRDIFSVDIEAMVYFKVMEDSKSIKRAAQQLLSRTNEEVANMIHGIVNARLREISATLSVDELQNEMANLNERVIKASKPDFEQLGFTIKIFTVRRIIDRDGYFEARADETRSQLIIRQAEAKKKADMGAADALLKRETRKAEVRTFLEYIWKEPILAKYRANQETEREKATSEMVAPMVSERLKIELAARKKK